MQFTLGCDILTLLFSLRSFQVFHVAKQLLHFCEPIQFQKKACRNSTFQKAKAGVEKVAICETH